MPCVPNAFILSLVTFCLVNYCSHGFKVAYNTVPSNKRRQVCFGIPSPHSKSMAATPKTNLVVTMGRKNGKRRRTSVIQQMVLTTPENVIEEASTQKLIDHLIDECVRTSARRPIIMQFDPSAIRIWKRWRGTVFSETWTFGVKNIIFATIITIFLHKHATAARTYLEGFNILWGQLLSVTTFTLTFFLNQSYSLWRKCYELSRRLQGRLNDLGMTLAAHAARTKPNAEETSEGSGGSEVANIGGSMSYSSTYTQPARQVLELVARYVRLFNLLTYASFTLSHRPILTPRGMRRLVERGLMTAREREVLVNATKLPATQKHNAVLLWIIRVFIEAREAGHLLGGAGFEEQFLEKIHVIRAQIGAIGDELQARMPLAYAHIVQVLVDVILWMYPITAFVSGINPVLSVVGTGLMTMFYQGLFDLAKQFLDPYDNENYGKGDDPLCVDTLVAETNAGSLRWMYGFEDQPFNSENLSELMLPIKGYSTAELLEREKEAELKKEWEEKDRKEREATKKEKIQKIIDSGYITDKNKTVALNETTATLASVPSNGVNETDIILGEKSHVSENRTVSTEILRVSEKNVTAVEGVGELGSLSSIDNLISDFGRIIPAERSEHEVDAIAVVSQQITFSNETAPAEPTFHVLSVEVNATDDSDIFNKTFPNGFDEWWHKLDPKGKDFMLSQILADDSIQWNGASNQTSNREEETPPKPMSIDEFKEKAIEIVKKTAEELYETEAILKAPPGANSIEELDEEQQASRALSVLAATEFLLMEDQSANNDNTTDLDVLEMDNPFVSSGSDIKPQNSDETAEIIDTSKYGDESSAVIINSGDVDSSLILKDISSAIQADPPDNESTAPLNDDSSTREMTDLNV